LLIAISAAASEAVDELRRAEMAFAKAFADRDQAKFFSFVLDDATFLGFRTLSGTIRSLTEPSGCFSQTDE